MNRKPQPSVPCYVRLTPEVNRILERIMRMIGGQEKGRKTRAVSMCIEGGYETIRPMVEVKPKATPEQIEAVLTGAVNATEEDD